MSNKVGYLSYSLCDIRQQYSVHSVEEDKWTRKAVLVGINERGLRLRYPRGTKSPVQYAKEASSDLKSLSALLVAGLLPAGVFADKLQEEFPQHEEAANILREWENCYKR